MLGRLIALAVVVSILNSFVVIGTAGYSLRIDPPPPAPSGVLDALAYVGKMAAWIVKTLITIFGAAFDWSWLPAPLSTVAFALHASLVAAGLIAGVGTVLGGAK